MPPEFVYLYSIYPLCLHLTRLWTTYHLVQICTGWNHRIDNFFFFNDILDQDGAFMIAGKIDRLFHLVTAGHTHSRNTIGLCQRNEIRVKHRCGMVAFFIEEL